MAGSSSSILRPETLRQLEQLELAVIKRSRSSTRGERQSRARGHSVEFADHRNYSRGDDLRYLDWNLYGRLDKLFVKLYEEEREVPVQLFLDASESMKFGTPRKFDTARSIAAAIGYLTIAGYDKLSFTTAPESTCPKPARQFFRSIRGKALGMRFLQNLEMIEPGGQSSIGDWFNHLQHASGPRGLAIAISDFLDDQPFADALRKAAGSGFQIILIHMLSPQEITPPVQGELRMVDAETGASQEVTFGRYRLKAYQQMVQGFKDQIRENCRGCGAHYVFCQSDVELQHFLFKTLREEGVLR